MKKLLSLILIFASVLILCTGCKPSDETPDEPSKEQKYDVSMKIVIEGVGEYIFTPDVSEMTVTIPYDGVSRKVYLAGYQYPDHPMKTHRESWLMPRFEGSDSFATDLIMKTEMGWSLEKKQIDEQGEYLFICEALSRSQSWNRRVVRLYVTLD